MRERERKKKRVLGEAEYKEERYKYIHARKVVNVCCSREGSQKKALPLQFQYLINWAQSPCYYYIMKLVLLSMRM